jgi:hypothetical protein
MSAVNRLLTASTGDKVNLQGGAAMPAIEQSINALNSSEARMHVQQTCFRNRELGVSNV